MHLCRLRLGLCVGFDIVIVRRMHLIRKRDDRFFLFVEKHEQLKVRRQRNNVQSKKCSEYTNTLSEVLMVYEFVRVKVFPSYLVSNLKCPMSNVLCPMSCVPCLVSNVQYRFLISNPRMFDLTRWFLIFVNSQHGIKGECVCLKNFALFLAALDRIKNRSVSEDTVSVFGQEEIIGNGR